MRHAAILLLLCSCGTALGCAAGRVGPVAPRDPARLLVEPEPSGDAGIVVSDAPAAPPGPPPQIVALAGRQAPTGEYEEEEMDEAPPSPFEDEQYAAPDEPQEEVIAPEPAVESGFKLGAGEVDIDRFSRRVDEVPLDIRPTEGTMPDDMSAAEFSDEPMAAVPGPAEGRAEVPVSYSPWTICYRPLYFEEIDLERYGDSYGILQPAVSGAHFFGSVAAMPYKMVVRPPRSCECSNGFSRCCDCPLPGYGERVWRADAGLVEAGIVAGIVLALP